MKHLILVASLLTAAAAAQQDTEALPARGDTDWRAFRGSDGAASSPTRVAREWSDSRNLLWRAALPGPGSSSPIIVDDRIFVTCWTGYGLDRESPGDIAGLERRLICLDVATGKVRWSKSVDPAASEDEFSGRLATHGYASSTPVSDGERVYVQFGKSGVFAFGLDGEQLWRADTGHGSSRWKTGSGSSPALWEDILLVNASDESHSVRALDRDTGKELWRRSTESLDQAYGVPVVAATPEGPTMFLALLGEIWALDPSTGKPRWIAKTKTNGALAPTIVLGDGMLFSFGGQTKERSYAVRSGNVAEGAARIVWASRYGAYVSTPLLHDGHLYWANDGGIACCMRAADGELVYKKRLGGRFYSSPVRAGDAIYYVSRTDGTYVLAAKPEFELLAHNHFEDDDSEFDATPAISGDRLFLRSRRFLYCIADSDQRRK